MLRNYYTLDQKNNPDDKNFKYSWGFNKPLSTSGFFVSFTSGWKSEPELLKQLVRNTAISNYNYYRNPSQGATI